MDAYIFQADVWCEDCARDIQFRLSHRKDDEDSDAYPQGPYSDGGGEADCPQHCGGCRVFLENPLTSHGVDYVVEQHRDNPSDITQEWVDYYGLSDRFIQDSDIIEAIQPIYPDNAYLELHPEAQED